MWAKPKSELSVELNPGDAFSMDLIAGFSSQLIQDLVIIIMELLKHPGFIHKNEIYISYNKVLTNYHIPADTRKALGVV